MDAQTARLVDAHIKRLIAEVRERRDAQAMIEGTRPGVMAAFGVAALGLACGATGFLVASAILR